MKTEPRRRVAVAQLEASTVKSENLARAIRCVAEAKSQGAGLLAFPEFLMAYSSAQQSNQELCEIAESLEGEFTSALRRAAEQNEIDLVATVYEKSAHPARVYDTALLIDRRGNLVSVYRKLHLYDALGFKESDKLVPGDDLAGPIETQIGRAGVMICYDVRFPELSRILALMGAEILIVPSGWVQGDGKVEHWRILLQARAIENGCYVIAPNQAGNIYTGHSLVVDPFGRLVLDMGGREGVETVELDLELLRTVRDKLPLLRHRRADVYSKIRGEELTKKEGGMILSKNRDVEGRLIKSVEGKTLEGKVILKAMMTGDQMTVLEIAYAAGAGTPMHVHQHESVVYVVKGSMRMVVGNEEYVLNAGDVCRHPKGVPHSVEGIEESLVVEIKSPTQPLEQFLGT